MKLHETVGRVVPLVLVAAIGAGCTSENKPAPEEYRGDACANPQPLTIVHMVGSNARGELEMVNDGECALVKEVGGAKPIGEIATNEHFFAVCDTGSNSLRVIIEPNQSGVAFYDKGLVDPGGDLQLEDPFIRPC